jgi:26S proteasome regulatory subunit N9
LWHQLTTQVLEFFQEKESAPYQISIFQNFVAEWEDKINKLSLATIALKAATQFSGNLDIYI